MDMSTEVHSGIKREDNQSPFLETHIWPVTRDVVKHYLTVNRNITSVEIVSSILHDVMEDNDRILDLYKTKDTVLMHISNIDLATESTRFVWT